MKRFAVLGVPFLFATIAGCYSAQPVVGAALPEGSTVLLQVTDQGRAALTAQLGPSVDVVEGRLVSRTDSAWIVSVTGVELLRGGHQTWAGERIRIGAEQVARVSQKQFSRSRTAIVSAAVLGVVVAAARGSLAGLISGSDGKVPSDSAASVRIPRP